MRNVAVFPCWEKPTRCLIRSNKHGSLLSSIKIGWANVRNERKNPNSDFVNQDPLFEEWFLIPVTENVVGSSDDSSEGWDLVSNSSGASSDDSICSSKLFYIVSCEYERYLSAGVPYTSLSTKKLRKGELPGDSEKFRIVKYPDHSGEIKYRIVSLAHPLRPLACNGKAVDLLGRSSRNLSNRSKNDDDDDDWETAWKFEFMTGELCFLSSSGNNLCCSPWGALSFNDNPGSWEVWRFIEVGDGSVVISSWPHAFKFLTVGANGNVCITNNRNDKRAHWKLEKFNGNNQNTGVIIRSVVCDEKVLSAQDDTLLLVKSNYDEAAVGKTLWQMEPANRNMFNVSIGGKSLASSKSGKPIISDNYGESAIWKLVPDNNDSQMVSLQNWKQGTWLVAGANNAGDNEPLGMATGNRDDAAQWMVKPSSFKDGAAYLVSYDSAMKLAYNGSKFYLTDADDENPDHVNWWLEPVLPTIVSSKHMITPVLGATALALAAPFEILFAVGMVTAATIAQEEKDAERSRKGVLRTLQNMGGTGLRLFGTTSPSGKRNISSGGVVDLQSVVESGIFKRAGIASPTEAKILDEDIRSRPVCSWRTW